MRTSRLKLVKDGLVKLVSGLALAAATIFGNAETPIHEDKSTLESLMADWYVDGSVTKSDDGKTWQTAFKTIQEGIDATFDADTVIIASGTYVENICFYGKNITLTSIDPLDSDIVASTIVDGNQAGPVVTFDGTENETCVLTGFTIQNGNSSEGGGILGGKFEGDQTYATIQNNTITENSAGNGGGLAWCDGKIENNIITKNRSSRGGGLYGCDGSIQYNTINNNLSKYCGGGLADCHGTIQNNTISSNSLFGDGGGLGYCLGEIQNNIISFNSAGEGGGLAYCGGIIRNNLIVRNIAPISGGGLWWCNGKIENNTIAQNFTENVAGGGLYVCKGIIRNCIIWENKAPINAQIHNSSMPTYSCIQDWTGGGDSNISADPLFFDPENNDFHLKPNSPSLAPNCAPGYSEMGAYAQYIGNIEKIIKINRDIEILTDGKPSYRVQLYRHSSPFEIITNGLKINEGTIGLDGKLILFDSIENTPKQRFYQAVITKE